MEVYIEILVAPKGFLLAWALNSRSSTVHVGVNGMVAYLSCMF